MTDVIVQSGLFTLVMAIAAVASVVLVLRGFDRLTGVSFDSVREVIKGEPLAAAVYYGLRFMGACWLFGQLFS